MDQGEVGTCMFTIYSGECGVYVFNQSTSGEAAQENTHRAVAVIGANTVVGEAAVIDKFDSGRRSATVLAHT